MFLVRRARIWTTRRIVGVAADDGVELAVLGLGGEVAAEALERLVALLGVLVGDAVGAADLGQRGLEALVGGARGAQRVAGAARMGGEREQQVLGRDVVVGEPAGLAVGAVEHGGELGGDRRRLGGGASVDRAGPRGSPPARRGSRPASAPSLRSSEPAMPSSSREQRREHVAGRDLRIAGGLGEADGLGEGLLGADREAIWLHEI